MHKLKAFILFSISIIFLLVSISSAFAEEKITLSTYYPAPIAEYCDLETEKSFTAGEENTTSDPFTNITPFYGDLSILPQNRDVWDGLEGGSVGIGTDTPTTGTRLEVVGGLIKATGGLIIETRTSTPTVPVAGQLWLRTDIAGSIGGSLEWFVTYNPGTGDDVAHGITSDADYVYVTGSKYATVANGGTTGWMRKYSKSDGGLIWTRQVTRSYNEGNTLTSDADYLYIGGFEYINPVEPNNQWRIEKRLKSTGGLIWAQTYNPSIAHDMPYSITSDADYLYIAGYDGSQPWRQWRIEKRRKSDGGLEWTRTTSPSALFASDYAYSITSDADYLYIAGYISSPGSGRMQKRLKSTGGLVWTVDSLASGNSITSDNDYIYIGTSSNMQKRLKSTGGLIWTASAPGYGITSDTDYVYGTGWQFKTEKHSKSDGSLIWTVTSDPSPGTDRAQSMVSDADYVYIVGYDDSPGNNQWRIEKRSKGLIIDIGLRAYDGTEIITIACEPESAVSSALRIGKDSKIYGIVLVGPTDTDASSIRIKTSSGVKALKIME